MQNHVKMKGVSFLTDETHHRRYVQLDLEEVAGIGEDELEDLLDAIIAEARKNVQSAMGGQKTVLEVPIKFHKNSYLNSFDDFWKLQALFKKEELKKVLNSFSGEISNAFIEAIFKTGNLKIFTDDNKKYLFAYTSPAFSKKYGELTPINALAALKQYGIDKLEQASEKGHIKI